MKTACPNCAAALEVNNFYGSPIKCPLCEIEFGSIPKPQRIDRKTSAVIALVVGLIVVFGIACTAISSMAKEASKTKTEADARFVKEKGLTPLHIAAGKGDIAAVRLLIESGADPEEADHEGTTPLDIASVIHALQMSVFYPLQPAHLGLAPDDRCCPAGALFRDKHDLDERGLQHRPQRHACGLCAVGQRWQLL